MAAQELNRAQVVMKRCEAYREELRNFTDSLPGIIAGNEVPTKRADLVKWQGGFKSAAHHLRALLAEVEKLRRLLDESEGVLEKHGIEE